MGLPTNIYFDREWKLLGITDWFEGEIISNYPHKEILLSHCTSAVFNLAL